jgi:dipeptidyl aminopeptidase/acylaminoacyl peptidase
MKKAILFLAVPLMIWSCNSDKGKMEQRTVKQYSIDQFYQNTNYSGGSFSPDESKLLVSSNATGIYNLYALHTDGSGIDTLTQNEKESYYAISYFPSDERVLFSADQGGNELNHIYLLDVDGNITDLTPGEKEKASFMKWNDDQLTFYYTSNLRDSRYFDLYEMDIENFETKLIYENTEGLNASDISNDKRYLALSKTILRDQSEMYLYDLEEKNLRLLSPEGEVANYHPMEFSHDNEKLYFTTDAGSEFFYLSSVDLVSGEIAKVFSTDWDVANAFHSESGAYRVVLVNEDAQRTIYLFNTADGSMVDMQALDGLGVTSVNFSPSEKRVRLTASDSRSPSDLYVYHLDNKDKTRLTYSLNPDIDYNDLVEGQVVRYESFDGLEIPSILYKPHQATADNKVPVLVWVHGGPGGQTSLSYSPLIQYLVNHGYAVIGVNNRGSSGYGKTFYGLDDQRHGEDDLQDCVLSKEYLSTLDWADTSRVGIIGGSYGGYMVMAALAFEPEAFDVGVNIFGVTNWLRTLKSIPAWWESQRIALYNELGDPFSEDSIRLHKISPLFHTQNVTKPLMVLQGANDPRVLQVESDEIVDGVRANNVPVTYVLFPDEGHGFRKKENEINGYGQIKDFLDEYLKGKK